MKKKIVLFCIIAISIIGFYAYFTRAIHFNNMINLDNREDIHNIRILTHYREASFGESKEFIIKDKKEINELLNILDSYEYSKKVNFKNLIPGDSKIISGHRNSFIQILITSYNSTNQIKRYNFTINPNNLINIDYLTDKQWENEYTTGRNIVSIFANLSGYLKSIMENDIKRFK